MDTLDGTSWDVIISGTGLQQSLLALALSRSDKKVLHIDKNGFYGGSEAAFSLQEAEEWAQRLEQGVPSPTFGNTNISKPSPEEASNDTPNLSFSRAYSLALAPQIIYSRSAVLQALISSKVYRQLEFQAVGNWYIYQPPLSPDDADTSPATEPDTPQSTPKATLSKVPNGREDIFASPTISLRSKRSLMNFLRFVADYESHPEQYTSHLTQPLPEFLIDQYRIPAELHQPLLALALSPNASQNTTVEYALPRIARHLRSTGVFGPGFGAVVPKWGGLAEIAQVACRAGAVGGTTYVLKKGIEKIDGDVREQETGISVTLDGGELVAAKWIVGGVEDLPVTESSESDTSGSGVEAGSLMRSISIVASPMVSLLPPVAESAPTPAAAIVVFPPCSLSGVAQGVSINQEVPVHVVIHSSDTGECPSGQVVLYTSTRTAGNEGRVLLKNAIEHLLEATEEPTPKVLWSMTYEQHGSRAATVNGVAEGSAALISDRILRLPPASLDLALDDSTLEDVQIVWRKIMGDEAEGFMSFEDRQGETFDDEGGDGV
ncbi:MAG: Rab proteins geranylgeranyltransferase component A [Bogoriella megaspora]|nr:MAG: Rab proteins geranylgeranyltransferase component A [Bogoriella megaspora]